MITCKNCRHANLEDAYFCESCGKNLAANCERCRKTNQRGATYCRFCGWKLGEPFTDSPVSPSREFPLAPDNSAFDADDRDDLIDEHRKALRDYVGFWFDSASREDVGMSEPEAAYHVCLHVGFLDRSTGDSKVAGGLLGLDPSDRVRLILAAAAYLGGLSVIRTLRQLVESDVLEPEQIEQAADLMLARDGAEEVLRVLRDLAKNLPAEHCDGVLAALARAEIVTAEIDDLFESRPDVLSVLAPFMSGVRDRIVTTIDPIRQWWFSRLDASETQLDAVTPNDLLPVAEVASAAPVPDSAPNIVLADPPQAPACFVAWEQSRALAASSGSTSYVQPFQVSCSEEPGLRGTMLVLPAHVYQFLLQRVAGAEKSRAGDGDYVAAYADREELARAELRDGHAVLQAGRMPTEFRLILRDDRCWTLRLDALEGIPG